MRIKIEVIYALAQRQERVLLDLPPESTVLDAIHASGLLRYMLRGQLGRIGVWGKSVIPETRLRDRDRVELYRALVADPNKVRRDRAAKTRK